MKNIYFIDSENVNDAWIVLASKVTDADELLVFYTAKSPHMSYEKVIELTSVSTRPINWIKCVEGTNALDFQLVTELGYRIAVEKDAKFVIVSNDNGFDAVVRYWKDRGSEVLRMRSSDCAAMAMAVAAQEKKCESAEGSKTDKVEEPIVSEATTPIALSDFMDEVVALSKFIPGDKITIFHDCLVCLYSQDKGDAMYYAMKAEKSEVEKLKKNCLKRTDSRVKAYIEYVFSKAGVSKQTASKIAAFYNKFEEPTKNLAKMNTELIKLFGQEYGSEYYKLLKKHVKVMNKL